MIIYLSYIINTYTNNDNNNNDEDMKEKWSVDGM